MKHLLPVLLQLLLLTGVSASAEEFSIQKDGGFSIGNLGFQIIHFAPGWRATRVSPENFLLKTTPSPASGPMVFDGEFNVPGGPLSLREELRRTAAQSLEFSATVRSAGGVPTELVALTARLPLNLVRQTGLLCDGRKVSPRKQEGTSFAFRFRKVVLMLETGTLHIESDRVRLQIQDNRNWNSNSISLRFWFHNNGKMLQEGALKLRFRFIPYQSIPVDLAGIVNMGLSDETGNDRRGGWTDQGKENDMRLLPAGEMNANGVLYRILDERKNAGRATIVLRGRQRPWLPEALAVRLPENRQVHRYLYLLNGCAWVDRSAPAGNVRVEYGDGSSDTFSVTPGVNTENFWGYKTVPEAETGWRGENNSGRVSLYSIAFKLAEKPVVRLTFTSNDRSVWMIPAVTFSNRPPLPGIEQRKQVGNQPVTIQASSELKPFSDKKIKSGTLLDFSFLNDAPAGKFGRVIADNDKFVLEKHPGKAIRFWGTNVCGQANIPSAEHAVFVADDLARRGYNLLRIHHFDNWIVRRNEGGGGTSLDPDAMAKLDFFLAELKKRGIYVTTDLFISRAIRPGDIPGCGGRGFRGIEYKMLCFVHPPARENLKRFTANFLNHVNPHTKLAYREDPQFITINLLNEDTLIGNELARDARENNPFLKKRFAEEFSAYCKRRGLPEKQEHYNGFLEELHDRFYREMHTFLRSLPCNILLADQNMCHNYNSVLLRRRYDYIDNHAYWGHPSFPGKRWQMPMQIMPQESIIPHSMGTLGMIATTQLLDKPFTVSEWCFVNPNPTSSEGSLLTAAFAALQGWDALNRFAYSHVGDSAYAKKQGVRTCFDDVHDPLVRLGEQLGALLFRSGALRESPDCFAIQLDRELNRERSQIFHSAARTRQLALLSRIGCAVNEEDGTLPLPPQTRAVIRSSGRRISRLPEAGDDWQVLHSLAAQKVVSRRVIEQEKFQSSTGEMEWDVKNGTFRLAAPTAEAFVLPAGKTLSGKTFSIASDRQFTTAAAVAMDNRPLAESERILLFHFFPVFNTDQRFRDGSLSIVERWGRPPLLAERSRITLASRRDLTGFTLFALDFDGNRLEQVSFTGNRIKLENFRGERVIAVYELTRRL